MTLEGSTAAKNRNPIKTKIQKILTVLLLVPTVFFQSGGLAIVALLSLPVPIAQAAGATRTWDGGGSGNLASTAANWSADTVPVAGDFVVFDATSTKAATWDLSSGITFASFSINAGAQAITLNTSLNLSGAYTQASGTVTFNGAGVTITAGADSTMTGGTITNTANSSAETYKTTISVTGSFNIGASATINVDAKGYAANQGTGKGVAGTGGTGYGSSTAPTNIGSGGTGAAGGGAIQLTVSGTLTVAGILSANGANGSGGGGGAGGSVYIITTGGTITGGGTIRANGGTGTSGDGSGGGYGGNGGNGTSSGQCCTWANGGGGGGRVALYYTTNTFSGTNTVYGGTRGGGNGVHGGAGTIYTKAASATNGDLLLDNSSNSGASTNQIATATFDNVTIKNAAVYVVPTGVTATVATAFTGGNSTGVVTVNSGGTLVLPSSGLTNAPGTFNNSGAVTTAATFTIPTGITFNHNSGASLSSMTALTLTGGTFVLTGNIGSSNTISGAITVTSGTLTINHSNTISTTGLVIGSGGTISHTANASAESYKVVISVTGDANIQSGGTINVDAKGYAANQGTGKGVNGTGGTGYGSISAPVNIGSGGTGAAGGGAIQLTVSGTLTVAGILSANGANGSGGGGGAGGSIYLDATGGTITGAGTIRANGGTGTSGDGSGGGYGGNGGGGTTGNVCCTWSSGGGGGGRVSMLYTTNTFAGTNTVTSGARGGGTSVAGGGGTKYLKQTAAANGSLTVDSSAATAPATTQITGTFADVTLSNSANVTVVTSGLTATGNLVINSGTTLLGVAQTLTVGGNFTNSGTFTQGTSTVAFNGSGTSTVSGSTTFYNLSCTTAAKPITFTAGTTQTISNALTLNGAAGTGNSIVLRSSTPGSYWIINPQGTRSVSYVDVKDSNNTNVTAITATNTIDSGHNNNWSITAPPPSDPTINNYNTGAYIATNVPALSFNLSDPSNLTVKYHIQIDDTADFSSPVADVTEGSLSASPRANVTYTPSALSDGSYYWRVQAINSGSVTGNYATANSGAVAFRVDATAPVSPSVNINSSATYATSTGATLTISATDASSGLADMMISEDAAFSGASWETYATLKSFTLSSSDGNKTVYIKFRDAVGNVSASASDTIILDSTAPTAGSLSINSSAASTNATATTLTISASDATSGLYQMEVSEDAGFVGAAYEAYATSRAFTLSAGDGTKTVYIRFKDNAGNVSASTSDTIVLDTVAPTSLSLTINSGSTYTGSVNATLAISATDPASGLYQMEVSEDSGFSGAVYEAYATTKSFILSGGDGTKTVYARFKDNAGNISSAASDTIVLDTTAPTSLSVSINSGSSYAAAQNVTLTISASDSTSGMYQMEVSEDAGFIGAVYEAYATSKAFALSGGDGTKTVYVRFTDNAGNVSSATSDTIVFDGTAPQSGSISINSGDSYTTSTAVTLTLSADDVTAGVYQMMISQEPDFITAIWESYATTKSFALDSSEGTKTVYVKFKDNAGNISGVVSDSIIYDATAPASGSISINGGDAFTGSAAVTLTLSASDATTSTAYMMFSEDAGFMGASWVPYDTTAAFTLSAGDGSKTVYARFKDVPGNVSAGTSDTITYDTTAPESGSLTINAGDTYTASATVTLTIGATDAASGVSEMMLASEPDFLVSLWEPYATTKSYTFGGGDGTKTVYVKFKDAVGNVSTSTYHYITYDATAPASTSVAINSGDTYATTSAVTLTLAATDPTSGVVSMMTSENSDFTGASWVPYAISQAFTLSGGDGAHVVYAKFVDSAGNESVAVSDDITVDTTAPTGTISINSGDAYTNSRNTTLTLSALDSVSGVGEMQVSENPAFTGAAWESYATSKAFTLAANDGTRTVYVRYRDTVGNTSNSYSDTIILDRQGPIAAEFSINGGATFVTSSSVTLTIGAIDLTTSVSQMMISESSIFAGAVWESYATSKAFALSAGEGLKTVYIKFRDPAGNSSLPTFSTITVDTTTPNGSVVINGGDGYMQSRDAVLTLAASDNLGAVSLMRVSEDASFTGVAWEPFATSRDFTFSAGDGTKVIYVAFQDEAGNIASAVNDAITYDATAPASNSVIINSDDATTAVRAVTLALSSVDATSGTVDMEVSEDNTFSDTTWELYDTVKSITLSTGDGTKTVYARFKDSAGNISAATSDAIILDMTAPTGSVVINAGAANTAVRPITLTLAASDATTSVVEMQVSTQSDFTGAVWEAFATTKSFTLTTGDGTKTAYARFRDTAGNISVTASDTIVYDTTAPSAVTISLNSDAAYTNTAALTLAISGSDAGTGLSQMMISNASDFTGAVWEAYATTKSWTIPSGDGNHVVYIKLRDAVLNTSSAAQDSIALDTISPTGSIVINSGNATTVTRAVVVALSAIDATSGVADMMLSEDPTFAGATWETYSTSKNFTLSATDGTKTLYAQFRDVAGNVSDVSSDTIVQDTAVLVPPIPSPTPSTKPTKTQSSSIGDASVAGTGTGTSTGSSSTGANSSTDGQSSGGDASPSTPSVSPQILTVTFLIVDTDNHPIPNAKVTLENGMVATTNSDGLVTFAGVEEGSETLIVEYENKIDERTVTVSKEASSVAVTVDGKRTSKGKLILAATITLGVAAGGLSVGLHFARLARIRKRRKIR